MATFERLNVANYAQTLAYHPYTLPSRSCRFRSLSHLMTSVRDSGNDFFTHDALRVFAIDRADVPTVFFVTSESHPAEVGERVYRIWYVSAPPGTRTLKVNTLRQVFDTLRMARLYAADARRVCG